MTTATSIVASSVFGTRARPLPTPPAPPFHASPLALSITPTPLTLSSGNILAEAPGVVLALPAGHRDGLWTSGPSDRPPWTPREASRRLRTGSDPHAPNDSWSPATNPELCDSYEIAARAKFHAQGLPSDVQFELEAIWPAPADTPRKVGRRS